MFEKFYKGFDKGMKCRNFQYTPGETYEEPEARVCECGFHACENPLDTFSYYRPGESRYCEVELDDVVRGGEGEGTKVAGKKIRIGAEIGIKGVIHAAVKFIFDKAEASECGKVTTGYRAHAATTGYRAHAATTGDDAHAATTGNYAHAEVKGQNSVAAALGHESVVRGGLGSWLIAVDWHFDSTAEKWEIRGVVTAHVDGKSIKPDVLYKAKDGAFVEVAQ